MIDAISAHRRAAVLRAARTRLPSLALVVVIGLTRPADAQSEAPNTPAPAPSASAGQGQAVSALAELSSDAREALALLDAALSQIGERTWLRPDEWAAVIDQLERAKRLAPLPNISFQLGSALYHAQQPERAREELERFLSIAGPNNENRQTAEVYLDELAASDATAAATSAPVPVAASTGRLPVGPIVVLGIGGAALIASAMTGLLVGASDGELSRNCDPDGACPDYLATVRDRGETLQLATNVLLITGAAAAAGGVLWWALSGSGERVTASTQARATRAGMACAADGCHASLSGVF